MTTFTRSSAIPILTPLLLVASISSCSLSTSVSDCDPSVSFDLTAADSQALIDTNAILEADYGPALRAAGITSIESRKASDVEGLDEKFPNRKTIIVTYIDGKGSPVQIDTVSDIAHPADISIKVTSSDVLLSGGLSTHYLGLVAPPAAVRTTFAEDMIVNAIAAVRTVAQMKKDWADRVAAAKARIKSRSVASQPDV